MTIELGKGIGPIRFGATFATVERLMGKPCTERSETRCAYPDRGVILDFRDGVVASIDVFRGGRLRADTEDPDDVFNVFNGAILPDILPGMVPEAVQEGLGKPERIEKLKGANPTNTVERHYYRGGILDYDYNPQTRRLMLGRIRLVPPQEAKPASSSSATTTN